MHDPLFCLEMKFDWRISKINNIFVGNTTIIIIRITMKIKSEIFTIALLLFSTTVSAQTPADSLAFANAKWHVYVDDGNFISKWARIEMFNSVQSISVVEYTSTAFDTRLVQTEAGGLTSELAKANGAKAAINAGYFVVETLRPSTYVRIGGKTIEIGREKENVRVDAVLAFVDGGIDIFSYPHNDCVNIEAGFSDLLASGPLMIEDGRAVHFEREDKFFGRNPRSFIGYRCNGQIVMCVVDGRFPQQGEGATMNELTFIARMLGLDEAINLDGGGSSTLWTERNGIINHPYDNHLFDSGGERVVTNAIIAVEKD